MALALAALLLTALSAGFAGATLVRNRSATDLERRVAALERELALRNAQAAEPARGAPGEAGARVDARAPR
jgi:hypothetical protein